MLYLDRGGEGVTGAGPIKTGRYAEGHHPPGLICDRPSGFATLIGFPCANATT